MELNFNWCLFLSKSKLGPICSGTCVRQFVPVVSLKKKNFCSLLLGAGARAGSGLKISGAVPKQADSETLISTIVFDGKYWRTGTLQIIQIFVYICLFLQVRANQEEKLKPYVVELENNIKQKLDRAKQAKEKQEELLMEKLAEHTRYTRQVNRSMCVLESADNSSWTKMSSLIQGCRL